MTHRTAPTPLRPGIGAPTARRGDRFNGCRLCGDTATHELTDARHDPQRACDHHLTRLTTAWTHLGWTPTTITPVPATQERAA